MNTASVQARVAFHPVHRVWKSTPEYYLDPWAYYVEFIRILQRRGAKFRTFSQALAGEYDPADINILLDHHIDHYPIEMEVMCRWEAANGVVSNIYLFNRVRNGHPIQARDWTIEDLNIPFYQELEHRGFEIGYHQNAVGQVRQQNDYDPVISAEHMEQARAVFAQDVDNLRRYFNIRTFIPHGGGECNSELTDLPEDCKRNLHWLYNNAPDDRSVDWQNYSDSCGQAPQVVNGFQAQYVLHVDNLHMKAQLAGPGLHHILVHPGRFGKGMPYELYEGGAAGTEAGEAASARLKPRVQFAFSYPLALQDLPVRTTRLLATWEGEEGRRAREAAAAGVGVHVPSTDAMYHLLTDDLLVLRSHMASNDLCIPALAVAGKLDRESKRALKRGDKKESRNPRSLPVPPDVASHLDQSRINELFRQQFLAWYNVVHSDRFLEHLRHAGLRFDCIQLRSLDIRRPQEIEHLPAILHRYQDASSFSLQLHCRFAPEKWRTCLAGHADVAEALDRYEIECVAAGRKAEEFTLRIELKPQHASALPAKSGDDVIAAANNRYMRTFQGTIDTPMAKLPANAGPFATYLHAARSIWSGLSGMRDGHHADNRMLYRKHVLSPPDPDILLDCIATVFDDVLNEARRKPEYQAVEFAWPWAYAAEACTIGYEATRDPRFLDLLIPSIDFILSQRDAFIGQVDHSRGRSLNAWGSTYFTDYARGKGYALPGHATDATAEPGGDNADDDDGEATPATAAKPVWTCNIVTTGRIVYPIARYCLLVNQNPALASPYHGKATEYLRGSIDAVNEFLPDFRKQFFRKGYFWRVERQEIEPLNHQNVFGRALLLLHHLTHDQRYGVIAARLARYFKSAMTIDEQDALVWGYKGPNAGPVRRSQEIEDVGHGTLNMQFAVAAHHAGVVFSTDDVRRMANTFVRNIYRGDKQFIGGLSPRRQNNVFKPGYAGHLLNWLLLSRVEPRIRAVLEDAVASRYDLFPDNWFTGTMGAVAYALRLHQLNATSS